MSGVASIAERLVRQGPKTTRAFLNRMSERQVSVLDHEWSFWGRPEQQFPTGKWLTWLYKGGRGTGKTRTGAEQTIEWARTNKYPRIALVAPTAADARDVMVEGESGVLACSPPWFKPLYEPSKRRLTWPNGTRGTLFSADEPARLNGPQHYKAWVDELGLWRRTEAYDMMMLGLRLGDSPQVVGTTTPKRKKRKFLKRLMKRRNTIVTTGSTYLNRLNLAEEFFTEVTTMYEGTRLGRQELHAEILEDIEGALLTIDIIDKHRFSPDNILEILTRIAVGVDPSGGRNKQGIVVAGRTNKCPCGNGAPQPHAFVLADATCQLTPEGWGSRVVGQYNGWDADIVVAERNYGGDMVASTIRAVDQSVPVKLVTASRGKHIRAEPIITLYEQGRVHHTGIFEVLEDQMCSFTEDGWGDEGDDEDSPDNADANVWALTELMLGKRSRIVRISS